MNSENKNNISPAKKSQKAGLNKKYLKIGSFSIAMTAVVIAVLVVLNLFIGEIPSTYTKFDLSSSSLFTLSGETEAVIQNVDEDVSFILLAQRGGENDSILELLGRYEALNGHIKIKTVDPITNPTYIEQFTTESVNENSVIVVSEKRHYVVDYSSIFVTQYSEEEYYNYYYYGVMPTGTPYFYGELAFTTALDFVTRDDLPTAYTLTGHGESDLSATIESYIKAENIARVSGYSLLTAETLPEDCAAVIINQPTSDISPEDCDKLVAYLDRGGHILLITDVMNYNAKAMPNLTSLAKHMGLEPVDGLVLETNKNYYWQTQNNLLPSLGSTSNPPLSNLSTDKINVLILNAHGILSDGSRTVTPLLSTTSQAYVKTNLSSQNVEYEEGDIAGTVYLGAASQIETEDGSTGKLVWFSSPSIVDDGVDIYASGGNSAVFMATANWMCENKINLSILAKNLQVEPLTVTEAQASFWSIVVIFVIPLTILVSGFVVWLRRRKN